MTKQIWKVGEDLGFTLLVWRFEFSTQAEAVQYATRDAARRGRLRLKVFSRFF